MGKKGLKEIRVGGVIILALTMMIIFVFSVGGDKAFFNGKVGYKIMFNSTSGLYEGDPVLLTGVEVGNVSKISFPKDIETMKILVEIEIAKDVAERIRKDSRARIAAASLVYGKVVSISMGSSGEAVIQPGGYIQADHAGGFSAMADTTSLVLNDIRSVLSKIDRGEGMLGLMLNNPMEMQQTLHHLAVSSQQLSSILERANHGEGALGVLLCDTMNFRQTLQDFAEVTNNLRNEETVVGKLINDTTYGKTVMTDLKSTLHSIANITAKIDTGKGSAGLLVNEDALYTGLEDVVLGMQRSKLTKWMIQNRRKAGEKHRKKQEEKAGENLD